MKVHIKIWNIAASRVIYDNMLGAADTADPATAVGGGLIVIYKEK